MRDSSQTGAWRGYGWRGRRWRGGSGGAGLIGGCGGEALKRAAASSTWGSGDIGIGNDVREFGWGFQE